ncbi:MAG TPA: MFS transporter [Candidatus Nanoarchaeia archaeon]|nr:MFS transporter [Candidatus Nanoarchaeia archaeon]
MKKIINTLIEGYSPLKLKDFRIYMGGQTISMLGTWMQQTAQAWVVWTLTNSELQLGIVAMLGFIPFLIIGPFAGVWADRINRRRLLIWTQFISMILAIAFAVLVQTNLIQVWHIYILAALLGIVSTLDLPAQQAFIGDLSGMENVRKAVVINSSIVQISRMIGPALAGWTIGIFGVAPAFWINGISFIAVIASLIAIKSSQVIHPHHGNPLNDFIDGLKFIKNNPIIMDLMFLTLIMTFFGFSIMQIMPAIATDVLHGRAEVLGFLMGASGAGALIGSTIIVPMTHKIKKIGLLSTVAVLWSGLWIIIFALSRNQYISMACLFLSALLIPILFATTNGLIQVTAPPHMKARVLSTLFIVAFGVQPFASLFTGYIAHLAGSAASVLLNGILMVLGAIILLLLRTELREWEPQMPAQKRKA